MEKKRSENIEETLNRLSSSKSGLLNSEAESRLKRHGYNEISEKKTGALE